MYKAVMKEVQHATHSGSTLASFGAIPATVVGGHHALPHRANDDARQRQQHRQLPPVLVCNVPKQHRPKGPGNKCNGKGRPCRQRVAAEKVDVNLGGEVPKDRKLVPAAENEGRMGMLQVRLDCSFFQ